MTAAEVRFLAASQQPVQRGDEPTAQAAKPKGRPAGSGRKPNLRPCPNCDLPLPVAEGQPYPPHNIHRTKTGDTHQPCDLPPGTIAGRRTTTPR